MEPGRPPLLSSLGAGTSNSDTWRVDTLRQLQLCSEEDIATNPRLYHWGTQASTLDQDYMDRVPLQSLNAGKRDKETSSSVTANFQPATCASSLAPQRRVFASWVYELLVVLVCLATTVTIVVILGREDGKPLTAWSSSISLNTVIATLGTIARTTLAFAISSCIGQQKWSWFRKNSDQLIAFERFDEASKGPLGGTRLFFWLKMR